MEGVKLNVESGSNALQDEPLDDFHNKMWAGSGGEQVCRSGDRRGRGGEVTAGQEWVAESETTWELLKWQSNQRIARDRNVN